MELKKHWRVFYYMYDLTEPVEKWYYTGFCAIVRAYWISMMTGFKVYVKEF